MTTTTQDSGAGIERERIAKAINDRWGLLCGWAGEPAIPGQWSRADLSKEFADAVLRASPVVGDEAREREGAPQEGAGSREPSPSVSASGFDPSREAWLREDRNALAAFARDVLDNAEDIDVGALQDLAFKHGLMEEVAYDPEAHGVFEDFDLDAGDPYYLLTDRCSPVAAPAIEARRAKTRRGFVEDEEWVVSRVMV